MTQADAATPRDRAPRPRKLAWIAAIALSTLVPGLLVSQLVGEREARLDEVRSQIAASWGPRQTVGGPTLVLPAAAIDGAPRYHAFAPRTLDTKVELAPATRRRGLFAATVYEATVTMIGRFDVPDVPAGGESDASRPAKALLFVDVTGAQGVRDDDRVEIAGASPAWQDCADVLRDEGACRGAAHPLVVEVDLLKATGATIPFTLTLHLRGTGSLRVATAAKHAKTRIAGTWPTPSYVGTDLPATSRNSDGTFEATWSSERIGRPASAATSSTIAPVGVQSDVGVDLIEAVPLYRTITRAAKYGLLIVTLAFAASFLFEVGAGVPVAIFQYGMLAASLSLFPLLLLSIGEILGYTLAYAVGAAMVTAQAGLYALAVTRRASAASGFSALLATVFGFFYALIGLETYSLVVGAIALFLVLSVVMAASERIVFATRRGRIGGAAAIDAES